jgi:hypothetical protein
MGIYYYGLFCHFIADFICQSREMGEKKSKSFSMLFYHVAVYNIVLFIMLFFVLSFQTAETVSAINSGSHLIIDFTTSKITTYFYTNNRMHAFFTTIGFDQFLHACVLIWTINHFAGA